MKYLRFDEKDHPSDISHHGILGMRWGVRNAETRERYQRGGAKEFEARCVKAGYSKRQAHEMAVGRDVLKKAAIGTLAVAGVAAAGVVGYHVVSRYGTKTIKAGKLIQTVHQGPIEQRVKGPFYATYKKADNNIYSSALFGHLNKNSKVTKLAASQNIKIASEARAHKTFKQLVKENPQITYQEVRYNPLVGANTVQPRVMRFNDYLRTQCKIDPNESLTVSDYRKFNYDLVHRNPRSDAIHNAFYGALKKQGFGAVTDSNDAFREAGGWTHNPLIVFGETKFNVAEQKMADIGSKQAQKNRERAERSARMRMYMNQPLSDHKSIYYTASVGVGAAGLVGLQTSEVSSREKFIDNYRTKHPGSKLSNAELRKMYEKQLGGL